VNGTVVFRGPRAKMGIYSGVPSRVMPHNTTGRADYFGPLVNRAARYCHAAARGGQVLIAKELMLSIIGQWVGAAPAMTAPGLLEYCVYFDAQRQRTWPWLFMRRHQTGAPTSQPVLEPVTGPLGLLSTGRSGLYGSFLPYDQGMMPPFTAAVAPGQTGCVGGLGVPAGPEGRTWKESAVPNDTAAGGEIEGSMHGIACGVGSCCGADVARVVGGVAGLAVSRGAGGHTGAACSSSSNPALGSSSGNPAPSATKVTSLNPHLDERGSWELGNGVYSKAGSSINSSAEVAAAGSGGAEGSTPVKHTVVQQQQQSCTQNGLLPPVLVGTGLGGLGLGPLHHSSMSRRPSQLQTLQEGQEVSVCSCPSLGLGWDGMEPPSGLGMEGVRHWVGQLDFGQEQEVTARGKAYGEGQDAAADESRMAQPQQQVLLEKQPGAGTHHVSADSETSHELSFAGCLQQPGQGRLSLATTGTTAVRGALIGVDGLQVQSSPNSRHRVWDGVPGVGLPPSRRQSCMSDPSSTESASCLLGPRGQQGFACRPPGGYSILGYGWSRTHHDKVRRCSWRSDCAVWQNADTDLNQLKMRLGARRPSATSDMLLARGARLGGYLPLDPRVQRVGYARTAPGSRRSSNISGISGEGVVNSRELWSGLAADDRLRGLGLQNRTPWQGASGGAGRKEQGPTQPAALPSGREVLHERYPAKSEVEQQLSPTGPSIAAADHPRQRRPLKGEVPGESGLVGPSSRTTHRSSGRSGSAGAYGSVTSSGDQGDSSRHSGGIGSSLGRASVAGVSGPSGQQLLLSELGQQVGLGLAASGGLHSSSKLRLVSKRRRQMSYCFDMETSGPGTPADGLVPLRGLNVGPGVLMPIPSQGSSSQRVSLSSSCGATVPSVVAEEEALEPKAAASGSGLSPNVPSVLAGLQAGLATGAANPGTSDMMGAADAGIIAAAAAGAAAPVVASRGAQRLAHMSMPVVQPRPEPQTLQSLRLQNTGVSSKPSSVHGTDVSTVFEGPSIFQTCRAVMSGTWLWARQLLIHDLGTFK
jgi:hypothetical protein